MSDSSNWLVHDHRRFEETLKECEIAAGAQDWAKAVLLFNEVIDDLKLHMRMEDEVIYPFFREEADDPNNDIGELMYEHDNLARLLTDLATVIRNRNFDHFEASLSPLYEAMLEHNAYEESVLARLGSESLVTRREEILQKLEEINPDFRRKWSF